MKKVLIVLVVLIVVVVGLLVWKGTSSNPIKTVLKTDPFTNKSKDGFAWGVTTRAHALANFSPEVWATQTKLAKELGSGYVRVNWENDGYLNGVRNAVGLNLAMIDGIIQNGMRPYIVLNQVGDLTKSADPYTDGYNLANEIAVAAKGQVDYYQLENEVTSWTLKGSQYPGEKADQYDTAKSEKLIAWLKGANAGIKAGDPQAKTVVTGQWIQYGFLQMIADANVNYDVIGWDWFSDMGLMSEKKLSDGTSITDKLKSFNKPLMLVEVGQRPDGNKSSGFKMDEAKQVAFIDSMAEWAHTSAAFKGFFAFELTDLPNHGPDGYIDRYGLVQFEPGSAGVAKMDHLRPAYTTYKNLVAKYSK